MFVGEPAWQLRTTCFSNPMSLVPLIYFGPDAALAHTVPVMAPSGHENSDTAFIAVQSNTGKRNKNIILWCERFQLIVLSMQLAATWFHDGQLKARPDSLTRARVIICGSVCHPAVALRAPGLQNTS